MGGHTASAQLGAGVAFNGDLAKHMLRFKLEFERAAFADRVANKSKKNSYTACNPFGIIWTRMQNSRQRHARKNTDKQAHTGTAPDHVVRLAVKPLGEFLQYGGIELRRTHRVTLYKSASSPRQTRQAAPSARF